MAGLFVPVPLPAASNQASTDGYDVTLGGRPIAGQESELTFTVRRNGEPVTDLEPYLGAFGHLVSLRGGDLAYLHTHPAEEAARVTAVVPRSGSARSSRPPARTGCSSTSSTAGPSTPPSSP